MTADKINAIIAASYNLHIGPFDGGDPMTPAKAAMLKRGDRAALARILADEGGSELYTKADAQAAFVQIINTR